jgi:hypothetical protein
VPIRAHPRFKKVHNAKSSHWISLDTAVSQDDNRRHAPIVVAAVFVPKISEFGIKHILARSSTWPVTFSKTYVNVPVVVVTFEYLFSTDVHIGIIQALTVTRTGFSVDVDLIEGTRYDPEIDPTIDSSGTLHYIVVSND